MELILSRKFRPNPFDNKPEEETRKNLAIPKFDAEISPLGLKVPKYRTKYENHDQVISYITRQHANKQKFWALGKRNKSGKIKSDDLLRSK